MKILVVTNMYPSDGDVSWRGSFVKEQIEAYIRLHPSSRIDVFHIKGKVSGASNFNYLIRFPTLIIKLLFGGYDVVHCHHAFCALLCIPWFGRFIYTIHEGELSTNTWRSKIIRLALSLSKIAIFVSQTEFSRSVKNRRYFLPCGVNFDVFIPAENRADIRKHLGLPTNKFIILFPADPNRPEKNSILLQEAEFIATNNKKNWLFRYGGKIPKEQMPQWMAAADVVVSVGRYESDGMVIKEAIASNTPVLSTDVGNSGIYIDDSCGLLVSPDSEHIYRALERMDKNRSQFSNGRERLQSLGQNMDNVSAQLNKIYQESIDS